MSNIHHQYFSVQYSFCFDDDDDDDDQNEEEKEDNEIINNRSLTAEKITNDTIISANPFDDVDFEEQTPSESINNTDEPDVIDMMTALCSMCGVRIPLEELADHVCDKVTATSSNIPSVIDTPLSSQLSSNFENMEVTTRSLESMMNSDSNKTDGESESLPCGKCGASVNVADLASHVCESSTPETPNSRRKWGFFAKKKSKRFNKDGRVRAISNQNAELLAELEKVRLETSESLKNVQEMQNQRK
eukprot:TRINITY_DN36_c0_g3_i1.p1 TRINITY_DN36_c0_g3~~TRINITY_DN36_c0_g3_i1.p1  ORF type:complete len:246 (-),score=80.56 TRINITY_DN36_c0_g3_i1:649-1386(-)